MKFLGWVIALPFIALALYVAARMIMCKPDREVVKVATPMVERIADYIVEHGVPESLADIPDLPYGVEGCSRSVRYRKLVEVSYKDTEKKEDASFAIINEGCRFTYKQNIYKVHFRFEDDYEVENDDRGDIDIRYEKTTVGITLKTQNGKLVRDQFGTGFDRRFGFCQQFKQ